jgi:peptidoglycan/LPS O-acetylase OafA/YrhL
MTWAKPVSAKLVLLHILFLGDYDWSQYNTALWSLVLELRVSIVFPFLFASVSRLRAGRAVLLAVCLSLIASATTYRRPELEQLMQTLQVAGIFIFGILLARDMAVVSSWYRRMGRAGHIVLAILSFVLYTWGHHITSTIDAIWAPDVWLITFGAIGYVVLGLNSPFLRGILNSRILQFFGRISYSLYLIHGTVLFALAYGLRGRLFVITQFLLYLALSILLATAFCVTIEQPFMRLGKRVSLWSKERRKLTEFRRDQLRAIGDMDIKETI